MYYIGIDLGTSAVKLLLMQGDGQIANIVSREYPIAFPHPGWSEQNPADWWDAVCAGILLCVVFFLAVPSAFSLFYRTFPCKCKKERIK